MHRREEFAIQALSRPARRRIFASAVLSILGLAGLLAIDSLRAQPSNPPLQLPPSSAVDLAITGTGEIVVTIPSGSPPFQIPGSNDWVVTIPGGKTVPPGNDLVVSFPRGGKVVLRPCQNRSISVTGDALVTNVVQRPVKLGARRNEQ